MKIVALELKNVGSDLDLSYYEKLGDFSRYELTKQEEIEDRAADAEILIINKLKINESSIGSLNKLKLICVTATGYDNVDVEYCRSRGIAVCNVKGYSTNSVVQHTFALLFYLYEKLNYYDKYVKDGNYIKCDIFTYFDNYFNELSGKTWGIVGLGNIGRGVANVAKAFGCRVIYYSTSGKNAAEDYERVEFDELLKRADIISIHSPLNAATLGLFNKEAFEKMKKTAYLINVGRGPIVNEKDLRWALENDIIAGAGLDVIEAEPMKADNPLFGYNNSEKLIVTPHIAWATVEARERLMQEVYNNIEAFYNNEERNRV